MSTVTLGAGNFEEVVTANEVVLVDFWAGWCGPCRMFAPIYEKAAEKYPEIAFAKVDTESEQTLAAQFGIMSIPTLLAFRDQILVYAQPGALPAPVLDDLIQKIMGLEMDEVRGQLSEQDRPATVDG
jgi:thioredoxin